MNKIIEKHDLNIHALSESMKEALKTDDLYGKKIDMEEINWNGLQNELRLYMNDIRSTREIIWVIRSRGNEGNSFFQWNILE